MRIFALLVLSLLAPAERPIGKRESGNGSTRSRGPAACSQIGEARERLADPRQQIAPGAPPLLSFRYFPGADRHRFGKLDLMLDDAGH